jgi:hypothetical protein
VLLKLIPEAKRVADNGEEEHSGKQGPQLMPGIDRRSFTEAQYEVSIIVK